MKRKAKKESVISAAAELHESTSRSRSRQARLGRQILDALCAAAGPLSPDEAYGAVSAGASREEFDEAVETLLSHVDIEKDRKGMLSAAPARRWIAGEVVGKDGYGLVMRDDGGETLSLSEDQMCLVFPGDRVLVSRSGFDSRGNPSARIRRVTERNTTSLVGRLFRDEEGAFVTPIDRTCPHDVELPEFPQDCREGDVVTVLIERQPDADHLPAGRIAERVGAYTDPGMEVEIAVRRFGVPHVFSDAALEECAAMPDSVVARDRKGRVDLRDVPLVTIDGADSRDFDDAVFARREGADFRLLVAIADVSWYVKSGSPLDTDAQQRTTSVYFPRRVIPMLPEKLSNGLCSLNPGVERCCLVCDCVVDGAGQVTAYQFYPAIMKSHARLTYGEVWDALTGKAVTDNIAPVLDHIRTLQVLYSVLSQARRDRGAVDFETTETRIVSDASGRIQKIEPAERNDAHRMIEEAMLAANTCAADLLDRNRAAGLYRVHAGPTEERLEKLRAELAGYRLKLGGGDSPKPSDYAAVLGKIKDEPWAPMLQTAMLRSMSQAVYTPHNIGHYGLAYERYAHFTSPIRRYPDLMVHRVIRSILAGKRFTPRICGLDVATPNVRKLERVMPKPESGKPSRGALAAWETIGLVCSANERRADEASRDVVAWLKTVYMEQFIGEKLSGTVTAVMPFGMFVTLDDMFVEGLVRVSDIGYEFYAWDETRHALVGDVSGEAYKLGRKVSVTVAGADPETRRIEFRMAWNRPAQGKAQGAHKPRQRGGKGRR